MLSLMTDGNGEMNLYDYLFYRRVDKAFSACAENMILPEKRLSCAIKITSIKTSYLN